MAAESGFDRLRDTNGQEHRTAKEQTLDVKGENVRIVTTCRI